MNAAGENCILVVGKAYFRNESASFFCNFKRAKIKQWVNCCENSAVYLRGKSEAHKMICYVYDVKSDVTIGFFKHYKVY